MLEFLTQFLPPDIPLLPFLLLGSLGIGLAGASKAGFGGSVGLLSLPLMILACNGNSTFAIGLMLPLYIACDYIALISWWRKWDGRMLLQLLPGAIAGIAAAGVFMYAIRQAGQDQRLLDAALKIFVGCISLIFVGIALYNKLHRRQRVLRPTWGNGTAYGAACGVTSTFAHAAGPVMSMYLLPQQLPKGTFVASSVAFFWAVNQLKLAPYLMLDMINVSSLEASAMLLPAVVAGAALGLLVHNHVPQRLFTGVIHVLLTLAGAELLRKGMVELFR